MSSDARILQVIIESNFIPPPGKQSCLLEGAERRDSFNADNPCSILNKTKQKSRSTHTKNENQPRATAYADNLSVREFEWTGQSYIKGWPGEVNQWWAFFALSIWLEAYPSPGTGVLVLADSTGNGAWNLVHAMRALYYWAISTGIPFFPLNAFEGIKMCCVKYIILAYWLLQAETMPFLHKSIFFV